MNVRDYASLLRLSGRYTVTETLVEPKDWVADKNLGELDLPGEGVLILGIQRADGSYIGAPTGKTSIYEKDTMILYGKQEALVELDRRRAGQAGDNAHKKAVAKQQVLVKEQSKQEKEQEKKHQLEQEQTEPK